MLTLFTWFWRSFLIALFLSQMNVLMTYLGLSGYRTHRDQQPTLTYTSFFMRLLTFLFPLQFMRSYLMEIIVVNMAGLSLIILHQIVPNI